MSRAGLLSTEANSPPAAYKERYRSNSLCYTWLTYSNIRQQTRVRTLGTNGFFDCGFRKAAWHSSILFPLLQRSLRDL